MSSGLHYAQNYNPKWEGGYFANQSQSFGQLVYTEFEHNYWMNEDETEIELERADIINYVAKLMTEPDQLNEHFAGEDEQPTNKQVAEVFIDMLKSDDDAIHMEWF